MTQPQAVLVTAAGQSVGRAMAEKFLARGDQVHICDIDGKLVRSVLEVNPRLGGTICDVSDEQQVQRLFAEATERIGPIDVLINTVGIAGPRGPIDAMSFADWRKTLGANLNSMFLTIRQAVPSMRAKRHGAIVNFSSMSTKTAMPYRSPYVASKAGVEGLTKALARELGPHNIRVNAILPGAIDNQRLKDVLSRIAEQEGRTLEAVEREGLNFVSMRTKIQPGEIADMVLFLCSDPARHVSGQMIGVDGNLEWEILTATDPQRLVDLVGTGRSTIAETFAARVAANPAATFIISGSRSWTYCEAWIEARRFAGFLNANGVAGSRVAAFLPKGPHAIFTWFGCALSRTVFIALNYMQRGDVLEDMARRCGVELLVTDRAGWEFIGPIWRPAGSC